MTCPPPGRGGERENKISWSIGTKYEHKATHTHTHIERQREGGLTAYHQMYHIKIQNGGHVQPEDNDISMSSGIPINSNELI